MKKDSIVINNYISTPLSELFTKITCHFCFESFEISLEPITEYDGFEIFDCNICCNPNKVLFRIKDGLIHFIDVSSANE